MVEGNPQIGRGAIDRLGGRIGDHQPEAARLRFDAAQFEPLKSADKG